jgi:hypothetical protein
MLSTIDFGEDHGIEPFGSSYDHLEFQERDKFEDQAYSAGFNLSDPQLYAQSTKKFSLRAFLPPLNPGDDQKPDDTCPSEIVYEGDEIALNRSTEVEHNEVHMQAQCTRNEHSIGFFPADQHVFIFDAPLPQAPVIAYVPIVIGLFDEPYVEIEEDEDSDLDGGAQ